MTQAERVLEHMSKYGSITSLEAIKEYGILRLASRISDLRRNGYQIDSKMDYVVNRYGEKCRVKRYSLRKE